MSKIKRIRRWLRRKLWRKRGMDSRSKSGMTPMDSGSGSGMTQGGSGLTLKSRKVRGSRRPRLRSVLILIQESRG